MVNAIPWTAVADATPTLRNAGSSKRAIAGSPTHPRPSEAIVIPS